MEEQASTAPKSSNNMITIAGVIILLLLLGGGAYLFMNSNKTAAPSNTAPSPTEAMMQPTTAPTGMQASPSAGAMMDDKNAKTIEVSGKNFSFSPSTLTVKQGETVKVVFKNTDGFHNFVIDEFNVKTTPKQSPDTEEVTFVANKKGSFEYYCAVGKHRQMGMVGTLTVE